ncbi:MAG: hypothetical protein K6T31_09420 [Alicyclobacillus sp.]|nr:hypothetical protein [Alicyclobacillus sp.]
MNEHKETNSEQAADNPMRHPAKTGNRTATSGGLADRANAQGRRRRWRQVLSWGTLLVAVAGFAGLWDTVRHAVLPTAGDGVVATAGISDGERSNLNAPSGSGEATAGSDQRAGTGNGSISGPSPAGPNSGSSGYERHRHRIARGAGGGPGWSGAAGSGSAGIAAGDAQSPHVRSSAS